MVKFKEGDIVIVNQNTMGRIREIQYSGDIPAVLSLEKPVIIKVDVGDKRGVGIRFVPIVTSKSFILYLNGSFVFEEPVDTLKTQYLSFISGLKIVGKV